MRPEAQACGPQLRNRSSLSPLSAVQSLLPCSLPPSTPVSGPFLPLPCTQPQSSSADGHTLGHTALVQ